MKMFTSQTEGFDSLFGLDGFGKPPHHHSQTPENRRLSIKANGFRSTPDGSTHSVTYNYPDAGGN